MCNIKDRHVLKPETPKRNRRNETTETTGTAETPAKQQKLPKRSVQNRYYGPRTHIDNEGSVTGVLLHPAAQRLRRRG